MYVFLLPTYEGDEDEDEKMNAKVKFVILVVTMASRHAWATPACSTYACRCRLLTPGRFFRLHNDQSGKSNTRWNFSELMRKYSIIH